MPAGWVWVGATSVVPAWTCAWLCASVCSWAALNVADPPVAADDSYTADEDTVLTVAMPGVLANDVAAGLACLTIAMAGLELTVGVSWALCLDIAGDFSGSVTGVMNTLGNLGGAVSAVMIGYLATWFGWTIPFLVASFFCGVAALLAARVDPMRSAVAELNIRK